MTMVMRGMMVSLRRFKLGLLKLGFFGLMEMCDLGLQYFFWTCFGGLFLVSYFGCCYYHVTCIEIQTFFFLLLPMLDAFLFISKVHCPSVIFVCESSCFYEFLGFPSRMLFPSTKGMRLNVFSFGQLNIACFVYPRLFNTFWLNVFMHHRLFRRLALVRYILAHLSLFRHLAWSDTFSSSQAFLGTWLGQMLLVHLRLPRHLAQLDALYPPQALLGTFLLDAFGTSQVFLGTWVGRMLLVHLKLSRHLSWPNALYTPYALSSTCLVRCFQSILDFFRHLA